MAGITNQNENVVRPWQYSVKIETNARGYVQPSVHVYSDSVRAIEGLAVKLLELLVNDLRQSGFKLATDIANAEKL